MMIAEIKFAFISSSLTSVFPPFLPTLKKVLEIHIYIFSHCFCGKCVLALHDVQGLSAVKTNDFFSVKGDEFIDCLSSCRLLK
jgi:hypothetical protein